MAFFNDYDIEAFFLQYKELSEFLEH